MAVYNNITRDDLNIFLTNGYRTEEAKSHFEVIRLKGKATIILYRTGKMLIQGTHDGVEHAKKVWEKKPKETQNTKKQLMNITGSDESLKGDTFGGIIVAAVYAEKEERDMLEQIGVCDSKKISDSIIPKLAKKIKSICKYKLIELTPKQYNDKIKTMNVTQLLNELHNKVYIQGTHVVDRFPGCKAGHEAVPKAELKFIEVAAASIIARDAALKQFKTLEKKLGIPVPKGSAHIEEALAHLKKEKIDLEKFVKLDFKNVKEFFHL